MKIKRISGRLYNSFKNVVEQEPDFMKHFSYDGEYDIRDSIKRLNYVDVGTNFLSMVKIYYTRLLDQTGKNRWGWWTTPETNVTCFVHRVI